MTTACGSASHMTQLTVSINLYETPLHSDNCHSHVCVKIKANRFSCVPFNLVWKQTDQSMTFYKYSHEGRLSLWLNVPPDL